MSYKKISEKTEKELLRVYKKDYEKITNDTPLSVREWNFLNNYIRYGDVMKAVKATKELQAEKRSRDNCIRMGKAILNQPNVKAELERLIMDAKKSAQATVDEVMEYFTAVMRGEEKDQFGLDAPLSERTKAAQELAKRTIDIDNRKNGTADSVVEIKLDWSR